MNKATLFACLLIAFPLAVSAQNRAGEGNIRQVYNDNCSGCHGDEGDGGYGTSLIDDVWPDGSSDEDIAAVIRDGIPSGGMPGFADTLDEEQIRAMVILIREMVMKSEQEALQKLLEGEVVTTAGHRYRLEEAGAGEGLLWSIAFLPDGAMLVTQRDGPLWRFDGDGRTQITGTPDVWQRGQGGMMEVALHPDYAKNGWVYLSYSENTGAQEAGKNAGMTTVVRGKIENGAWTRQETLFRVNQDHHTSSGVHFGSRFAFDQGYLYFSIGDRGRMERAQDLGRPNGKIFRIHDDGRIPADNPFTGTPGALPEIWSYGHRNPQGMDIDPATGLLWASEHGPRGGDEVNLVAKGKNYGWPVITHGMNYNGTPITDETHREGMEQPKLHWTPSIAVAGIDFYEGDAFPQWTGKLLAGGLASEQLHLLTIENGEVTEDEVILKGRGRIRDVASGPDGNIYLLLNDGAPRKGTIVRMLPNEAAEAD